MNNLNYKEPQQKPITTSLAEYEIEARKIIERGGPDAHEYSFLTNVPKNAADISVEEQEVFYNFLSPILTSLDCMIGFAFQKPHGYAGDFEIIERIYNKRVSSDESLSKWDEYYHQLDAPMAVRNRKKYFQELVDSRLDNKQGTSVLNIGSGPCVDLYEYLSTHEGNKIKFECLDMDSTAIEYGSNLCSDYSDNLSFVNQNAFRFKPDHQYDLVWSAGMFDYFSDKLFSRLVNRMYNLVKEGGELVIGNFSTYNPTKNVMEVFTQWYLHHRDENTLIELAMNAGVKRENISVNKEPTGVNLFLHLKK